MADSPSRQIDRRIAELADWRGDTLARVRRLIKQAVPEVVEEWKWRGVPVWEHEGIICTGETYKEYVKLTFAKGASLADPARLFNASLEGNMRRAIDLHEHDRLDERAFKALVRAAAALNESKRTPTKKAKKPAKAKKATKATKAANPAKPAKKAAKAKKPARKAAKPAKKAKKASKPARKSTKKAAKASKPTKKAKKAAKRPKLLSGGNPQIAMGYGDDPVTAYIDAMPGWKADLGRRLDQLITRHIPDVRKAVKWNSPMYGIPGQGWLVSFHTFTRYVKVTFFPGAEMDPVPPGGSRDDGRWVDVYEDALDEPQMVRWLQQAARLPGWVTADIAE